MLILSWVILLVVLIYFIYFLKEIHSIHRQMNYILTNDTNAEITTSSRNKLLLKNVNDCNILIQRDKEMKRQQKLNEKELHQILTSLTHDLKTPLTVASGYTQLLLQQDTTSDLVAKIDKSLDSVNYYLACLSDYNLIQEKKIELNVKKINFSNFLSEQLFLYYEEFEQKEINIQIDIKPNLIIYSDKLLLKRIVENIVSNLLKYAVENIKISLVSDNNYIEFSCENGYIGEIINPDLLLMRFQTMDESRQNKSMGLGFHIIQELTEVMGGKFQIEVGRNVFKTMIQIAKA